MTEIQTKLFDHRDIKYKEFNSTLIPNIDKNLIIGVRVPDITRIAKELKGENKAEAFMRPTS